ncbi:NucA/NucB deoxyribonuclease domain-containing protein [Mangrovihabitans endophyticus]|nr:hypothetical protein [Mangrovihabitans endophyticus]
MTSHTPVHALDNEWTHYLHAGAIMSYGDAIGANLNAVGEPSGECSVRQNVFDGGSMPLGALRQGELGLTGTATAVGAIGYCRSGWTITVTAPGYNPASMTIRSTGIRCDNATGGNPRSAGCVIPWYAAAVTYSHVQQRTVAAHVEQAQGSGLPGATFDRPLTRASDTIRQRNRELACHDAVSLEGESCDEYPLASSQQGLTAGGTRRSFAGCLFPFIPSATGPTGVSVCMVDENDNWSQGGKMSVFYHNNRVLEGDPFRVLVVP